MPSEQEAIHAIPSNIDMNSIADAFNNPAQIFRMLDSNNDGRVTKEDLQTLLERLGVNGMAANILSKYIFKELDANNNGTIEASDLVNAGNILWNLFEKKQNTGGF